MVGTMSFMFLHILLVILFISNAISEEKPTELVEKCKTNKGLLISAWDWEVRNSKNESYFINICHRATNCDKDTSVCKRGVKKTNIKYGATVTGDITTMPNSKGFSITFNGTKKTGCENKKLQTRIHFHCDNILGSPEFVDDNGCLLIIEFSTKEACGKDDGNLKIPEIPCVIYNPIDKQKRDLTPLIKLKGGHHVSAEQHKVDIYINVCRDITFNAKIPANACGSKNGKTSSACRADTKLKQPIGRITKDTRLYYEDNKIKLTYNYTLPKPTQSCSHVTTRITFLCQTKISNGEAGPVLITNVTANKFSCAYEILWRTGHACPNNDVITDDCKFSNGEVTFDLTNLEKQKQLSYQVFDHDKKFEYRIKVCSNGQACGSDVYGKHTAVCQVETASGKAHSCGNAEQRSIRYADNVLTMIYKQGSKCSNGIERRTIITFHCEPSIDVGKPEFIEEQHCSYYFKWRTRHVCPSRKPGTCSVISKGETYDLSILTKVNSAWLAINNRQDASGYTYYINVCANLMSLKYPECRGSAVCEVPSKGKPRGIGMYKSTPNITKESGLSLKYTAGKCEGSDKDKNITTFIKFECKSKNLESPPELESRTWDGCDYVFTWSTAAACPLKVISGEDGDHSCVLEDTVTGNVYDLSPLGVPDHFNVSTSSAGQEFYVKVCTKKGLDSELCGKKSVSAGICQKTADGYFVAGNMNDKLYYYDGILKIKFAQGDRCTSKHKPERESHITFFCDESAGVGKPVFVGEPEHCVYSFVWNTKHACPLKTMECAIVKDGKEFNLSPLVKSDDNWEVVKDGKTYFINVCRVLHRTPKTSGCPVRSSVCMENSNGTDVVSIGRIEEGVNSGGSLKVNNDGLPYLHYQDGKYRTMINFQCDEQGRIGSPELSTSDIEHNSYIFEWTTKVACGVKSQAEPGCDDPDSTISVLSKRDGKGYKIGVDDGWINVDICQNISCNKVKTSTACFKPSKGDEFSIGRSTHSTVEHGQNLITLTYPNGNWDSTPTWANYYTTTISFVCSRDIATGKPTYVTRQKNVYYLEFKTSVACDAQAVECKTSKNGKRYNLKPLTLIDGNWMAADTRSHLDYYIDVCHEYYPGDLPSKCTGSGGIGGCQLDFKDAENPKPHNIGYVRSNPEVLSEGHVTLRYTGGEMCHKKYHRRTRINFFCSDIHGSPVFMIETKDCEYVFNWKTPSACPVLHHKEIKQSCAVYDKTYGVYYDLSSLNQFDVPEELEKKVKYQGGFCGTNSKCGKGFSSCFTKGNSVTESFTFKSMEFYDNKMSVIHKSKKANTIIVHEISCNTEGKELSFGGKSNSSSGYHVHWTSKFVCPPVTGEECSLTQGRDLYDLSVLAKENWNWLAENAVDEFDFKDYQFYFSVCKPLRHITGLQNSGSRAAIKDTKGKYISLGTMIAPLRISNGFLTMTYGYSDNIPSHCKNATTTIQFVCDDVIPEGVRVGPVVNGFDKTECKFHVTWLTRGACSVQSLKDNAESPRPCTAVHPATMKSIDLSSLNKPNRWKISDQDGNSYWLNVCGHAEGCSSKNSSICRIDGKKTISVGSINTSLIYRQGFLYLHYTNGEKCESDKDSTTETLITFMCDANAGEGKPTLERANDCTHFVTWKTSLACEAEVECVAHDGAKFYDLSPLIKNDDNYELEHNGKKYLINVCRSLVSSNSKCSSSASVCALPYENSPAKDLGHVRTPPTIVSQKDKKSETKVQLIYENKGSCQNKNTTINFVCDSQGEVDKPIIVYADDCYVVVTWWTSLVCEQEPVSNNSCTFSDPDQHYCFDLNRLAQNNPKNVAIPGGKAHFHVCGDASKDCNEGGETNSKSGEVCLMLNDKSRMALSRGDISYDGSKVQITYGDDVVLLLYCGKNNNWNRPQYIGQHEVNNIDGKKTKYFFNMITPEVCPPRKLSCEVKHGGKTYSLAGLRERGSYLVQGDNFNYWVSICGHVHLNANTKICSSRAAAIRVPRDSSGQPQVIGVDTHHTLTYQKDKSYPIILQYSSDEKVEECAGDKTPTVLHKFKCKHAMSQPRFGGFDRVKCMVTFLWELSEACAEKRTPMTQIGDDWTFYDEKSPGCDLDLTSLRNSVSKQKYTKDCPLSNDVELYSEEGDYELVVSCQVKKSSPPKKKAINIIIRCNLAMNDSKLLVNAQSSTYMSFLWETASVCVALRSSCSKSVSRPGAKSAIAVIGTLTGIGLLAAILFFACKPEKRETVGLWLRWHARKYICCKPSYQASYRYKKVNTSEEDGETDFIIEAGAGSLFSDSEDDDNHNSDDKDDDDDDLLPLDDDLLNLD